MWLSSHCFLSPLFIPPSECFPVLAPTRSGIGQWAGQDPVLKAAQTHLVLLLQKPPRRDNRPVGWSGVGSRADHEAVLGTFCCDRAVCFLSRSRGHAFVEMSGTLN